MNEQDATPDEAFDLGFVRGYDTALEEVAAILEGHPKCERHPLDDVIKCGWKNAVLELQAFLHASDN